MRVYDSLPSWLTPPSVLGADASVASVLTSGFGSSFTGAGAGVDSSGFFCSVELVAPAGSAGFAGEAVLDAAGVAFGYANTSGPVLNRIMPFYLSKSSTFATIITRKSFSLMLYSSNFLSSAKILPRSRISCYAPQSAILFGKHLPEKISFCWATGCPSDCSIFCFTASTLKVKKFSFADLFQDA